MTTLSLSLIPLFSRANADSIAFSGAIQIVTGNGETVPVTGSAPVPAQCPDQNPTSCGTIGAQGWCCPSANTCSWWNAKVACCLTGSTCSGWNGNEQTWTPVPARAPIQYPSPTVTSVAVAGVGQVIQAPAAPSYCSTIFAVGPGLPTTRPVSCGTAIIYPAYGAAPGLQARAVWGFSAVVVVATSMLSWHIF